MTWYTSASKLLAAMLVVCASTGARAAADKPEKSTLDQIKAAHPALAYETRYGTQPGVTNSFVESIYKSLTAKK